MKTTIEAGFYIETLDSWSNVTMTGPFATSDDATEYMTRIAHESSVRTAAELRHSIETFGPVVIQSPESPKC